MVTHFSAGHFSRASNYGEHRGGACTPRRKYGSRPDSVARALGVQTSREPTSNHGITFCVAKANQDHKKKLYFLAFLSLAAALPYVYHTDRPSTSFVAGRQGTTAPTQPTEAALQVLPSAVITDGASLCVHSPSFCRQIIGPGSYGRSSNTNYKTRAAQLIPLRNCRGYFLGSIRSHNALRFTKQPQQYPTAQHYSSSCTTSSSRASRPCLCDSYYCSFRVLCHCVCRTQQEIQSGSLT